MEPLSFFLIIIIVSVAFFCEATFGFGGGLISVPTISLIIGVKKAVPLILIFQLLIGITLCVSIFKKIRFKIISVLFIGLTIGVVLGTLVLAGLSEAILRKIIAFIIFLFLANNIFFKKIEINTRLHNLLGFGSGIFSGVFQSLAGAGGPPLVFYYVSIFKDKSLVRANLIISFLFANIIRVISGFYTSLISYDTMKQSLYILPFFLISVYLGSKFHLRLNQKVYETLVYILLFVSGTFLLLK